MPLYSHFIWPKTIDLINPDVHGIEVCIPSMQRGIASTVTLEVLDESLVEKRKQFERIIQLTTGTFPVALKESK